MAATLSTLTLASFAPNPVLADTIRPMGTGDDGSLETACEIGGGVFVSNGGLFACVGEGSWVRCWRIIDASGSHRGVCYGDVAARLKTDGKGPLSPPASLTTASGGQASVAPGGPVSGKSGNVANASGLKGSVGASTANPGGNGGKHAIGPGN